ncbi:MFS general substrate transporter [Viridothelium virens]|uniref:MFS general substrate transporter n=1 Tax=Viridothelium virens TaxID=1048519 RepID=A0A6A6H693_VIRVR|nr:MFS general substrate transporter [Viridothelium virens]
MSSSTPEHVGAGEDQSTEQTGLLPDTEEPNRIPPPQKANPTRVVFLIALAVVVLGGGEVLIANPRIRLFESIICREYYDKHETSIVKGDGWLPEHLCKIEPVESSVALLMGWQDFFDSIPALFLAIPYGWLADKYGRKPVVTMAIVAFWVRSALIMLICYFWQTLPLKLIWATSAHALFGGGIPVASAMAYAMMSDVVSKDERASNFLRLAAASLFINFLLPPISAVLMKRNLWIPMLLGLSVQLISIPVAISVPETLDRSGSTQRSDVSIHLPSNSANDVEYTPPLRPRSRFDQVKASVGFLFHDWRIPPLILTYLVHNGVDFMTLYLSKRYKWSIANATFLTSVRSGITVLVFLLLIPALSTILVQRFAFGNLSKDLWLGRMSCISIVIGYAIFGFAPNIAMSIIGMIIFTLGNGHAQLIRSFTTNLVEKHHVARLYTIIGIFETASLMIGSPLLAGLFQEGSQLGGSWIGLPFYFISGLFVCVTGLLFIVGAWEPKNAKHIVTEPGCEEEQGQGEEDGPWDLEYRDHDLGTGDLVNSSEALRDLTLSTTPSQRPMLS